MIKFLTKHIDLYSQLNGQSQLNILSSAINEVGFANLNKLKTIKNKDFRNSAGVYFINNSFSTSNIKKLLNLKLLNFFQNYKHKNKLLVTQDSNLGMKQLVKLKKNFNITNHLHLPNTVFFENSGTYINTEGSVNKTIKVITPLGQTKND
jgi:NADH dehydrogenase/NADH:ubiquinone oxidoreductase subunit G